MLKIIAKITKRMNRFCAFAAVLVLADLSFLIGRVECRGDDPNPNFADLWDEDLEEISVPEKLVVTSGEVPSFLSGGVLVRNGPGQLRSPKRFVYVKGCSKPPH